MITLLGSLLGFVSSIFPSLFKYLSDKQDKAHELAIMQLQMQYSKESASEHLEEIQVQGDIEQSKAIQEPENINIPWIEAYRASVRPTIAYVVFITFEVAKYYFFKHNLHWYIWTEADQILLATITSYYFGTRAFQKLCEK